MKISHENTPMHADIMKFFGTGIATREKAGMTVIFTWGDVIHNPNGSAIPGHLLVHEMVHRNQQLDPLTGKYDPVTWWKSYIASDSFRLRQEVEAYGREYAFACKVMNRKGRIGFMHKIAGELAGPLYRLGKLVTKDSAIDMIQNEASHHASDDFSKEIVEFNVEAHGLPQNTVNEAMERVMESARGIDEKIKKQ